MIEKIEQLMQEISALQAKNAQEAEALRIKYLSKKGEISLLMNDFRSVPAELKKEVGMKINELKNFAQEKINALKESAGEASASGSDAIDLTRTPYPIALGSRHPLTIVKNEIVDIFSRLGFTLADGPEVEDDWHVYSSMNFPDDHPARDMQDTFFV
ncbi:MAG: phenylalanine--tRNA ligase subunit alpha, partial [Bacteroidaceae bacterium]|nr:phenylalanine--tRNA ligase subunit alpha [Bacteroidaceae bacterium]